MSKKVLVISTSLRKNSNSEKLAEAFASGAEDAGNVVEFLSLKDKTIAFCEGCMACHKLGRCVIDDDANMIARKMYEAEVIAFAKQNKGYTVGIDSLGSQDTIAPAVTKGNETLLNWINDEIKTLGKENFFHADYDATLTDTYGADYKETLVVEGGEVKKS